jgi:hypothetical protein
MVFGAMLVGGLIGSSIARNRYESLSIEQEQQEQLQQAQAKAQQAEQAEQAQQAEQPKDLTYLRKMSFKNLRNWEI